MKVDFCRVPEAPKTFAQVEPAQVFTFGGSAHMRLKADSPGYNAVRLYDGKLLAFSSEIIIQQTYPEAILLLDPANWDNPYAD